MAWLHELHPGRVQLIEADIRHAEAVVRACDGVDVIFHLAGQTAVTRSVLNPRSDFEINALGTLNVLEAARSSASNPVIFLSSTNKVYGGMDDVAIAEYPTRYDYADGRSGVCETQPLDFHSPYGCSKGAADQYVHDYARIYGLRTVVFRQSCIYGPRQLGVEDQGWVAWFIIATSLGKSITIYGDGKQVRDLLHINDLLNAFEAALTHINTTAGHIYNIGGGHSNSLSIWREFGPLLEELFGHSIAVSLADWRPGDQQVYISDCRKAHEHFGWQPEIAVQDGIADLVNWVRRHHTLFTEL